MDPYLEQYSGDVHHGLIQYTRDLMQPELPSDLRARVEERVFLETDADAHRVFVPDVHIAQVLGKTGWSQTTGVSGVAVAEPLVFKIHSDPITEGYIEIRERRGGKLITVIEFLSPSNKAGGVGQRKYLEQQDEILGSDASLVEIDLVRAGGRVLALPEFDIPDHHRKDYLACISTGWDHSQRELYPMPLRQRLSALPIPLRENEKRLALDLQALVDHVYETGRYDDTDYTSELVQPLPTEDAAWAAGLFKCRAANAGE